MSDGAFLDPAQREAMASAYARAAYETWTPRRCARLGFLIGCGLPAEDVARDPALALADAAAVFRQANRLQVSITEARRRRYGFDFGSSEAAPLRSHAAKRGIAPDVLMLKIFRMLCAEPGLIDAVLDDGAPA